MRVVLCNCPVDKAADIARALVERGVAACVNVMEGVKSFYVWEGRLCEDAESTLLIKVAAAKVNALKAALRALHPYTVPEIVVLPVETRASHAPYVRWVKAAKGLS